MARCPRPDRRRRAERRGRRAETLTRLLLAIKGWRLVETRYRTPVGEIDLIVTRGRTLALIEVKQRPSESAALHAVDRRQRERIARAAQWYLARDGRRFADYSLRFDVVAVASGRWPRHVADAWRPESP